MDPGLCDIGREIRFQVVVAGDFELFPALLVQAQPEPAVDCDRSKKDENIAEQVYMRRQPES